MKILILLLVLVCWCGASLAAQPAVAMDVVLLATINLEMLVTYAIIFWLRHWRVLLSVIDALMERWVKILDKTYIQMKNVEYR